MKIRAAMMAVGLGAGSFACQAATVDVATLLANSGFESGSLSGWTLTQPNTTNYVSVLSPSVNPAINPADAGNSPATLGAPAGSFFTGLMRPGDLGADLSYKLAHNAVAVNVPTGTVFSVSVFANKGRLEPFDTPASTGSVSVRIFGWTAGAMPTVTAATDNWSRTISWNPAVQAFSFGATPDGTWAQQTFTFDPAANGRDAATIRFLTLSITAQNMNHDEYIATDIGLAAVPLPAGALLFVSGLFGLAFARRVRQPK